MSIHHEYQAFLARGKAKYGEKFDASNLAPQFKAHYHGGRIKVRTIYGDEEVWERTGTVGVTTGWKPAFLLMHRSSDHGSSDVLGVGDVIVAVQQGRKYVPIVWHHP
jgi:hypothetical protein